MDWWLIEDVPTPGDDYKYFLKVEGMVVYGTLIEYPTATHWATEETMF